MARGGEAVEKSFGRQPMLRRVASAAPVGEWRGAVQCCCYRRRCGRRLDYQAWVPAAAPDASHGARGGAWVPNTAAPDASHGAQPFRLQPRVQPHIDKCVRRHCKVESTGHLPPAHAVGKVESTGQLAASSRPTGIRLAASSSRCVLSSARRVLEHCGLRADGRGASCCCGVIATVEEHFLLLLLRHRHGHRHGRLRAEEHQSAQPTGQRPLRGRGAHPCCARGSVRPGLVAALGRSGAADSSVGGGTARRHRRL